MGELQRKAFSKPNGYTTLEDVIYASHEKIIQIYSVEYGFEGVEEDRNSTLKFLSWWFEQFPRYKERLKKFIDVSDFVGSGPIFYQTAVALHYYFVLTGRAAVNTMENGRGGEKKIENLADLKTVNWTSQSADQSLIKAYRMTAHAWARNDSYLARNFRGIFDTVGKYSEVVKYFGRAVNGKDVGTG